MEQASLTGTVSFGARLLRSECWRLSLMIAALLITLAGAIVRRGLDDAVMSADAAFYPNVAILVAGLFFQAIGLIMTRRRARAGRGVPEWERVFSVAVDLAIPFMILLIFQFHSPRGAEVAIAGPSLLLMPLVIMLSILRLRPWFSLATGLAAAALHAALVVRAIKVSDIQQNEYPAFFSYAALLAVMGAAAAVVSWLARRYVSESVAEATAAERTKRAMATIEQDMTVARDIQMGLLPSVRPAIGGFDVAGMARPAAHAGGDYYDWQPLPNNRLVVAVADVTGHGIGPALVMAVCRAYARASAPAIEGPETLLAHLNELIVEDVKGARFITMAVAVIDDGGNVQLVSAGHGPSFLYRAFDRSVEHFGGDGLPLGVMRNEKYGPRRDFRLETGDALVLLTDGFVEYARAADEALFGEARLAEVLQASAHLSSAEIISAIDEAVRQFADGSPQADDMTAVVIKRV